MSNHPDHHHPVRRVVLSTGKTIDFVYFPAAQPETAPVADLHVCPDCGCDMVHPVDWEEAGETAWRLRLRCPECDWELQDDFGLEAVERLDASLDRGMRVLVRDLTRFVQANMEDELERFISALHADQIWPIDF